MDSFFNHNFLSSLTMVVIAATATYVTYMNVASYQVKSKFYEMRLIKFYFPVFIHLENKLYKKLNTEEAYDIFVYLNNMCNNNKIYVNDRILDRLILMKKNIDLNKDYNEDFYSICTHLDNDLDFLQYKLGLPRRGFIYRLNRNQLAMNSFFNLKVVLEFTFHVLFPIIILSLFAKLILLI